MKIEKTTFDQIPAEIQAKVKAVLEDEAEIFEVSIFNDRGRTYYTVCAVDDLDFIEIGILDSGFLKVRKVSFWTVVSAIEKVPFIAKKLERVKMK